MPREAGRGSGTFNDILSRQEDINRSSFVPTIWSREGKGKERTKGTNAERGL